MNDADHPAAHHPGLAIPVNPPPSIIPARWGGRPNAVLASNAAEAAWPSVSPEMRRAKKIAPPGGRCRTTTSSPGRVISASSGAIASIGCTKPSLRFGPKIDTAGNSEQTILVAGGGTKETSERHSGRLEA